MAVPLYRQIAEEIAARIESGELAPGSALGPELDHRKTSGVSRNTIRDAVKWLVARGLVMSHPGRGTFVVERQAPFVSTLSIDRETGLSGDDGLAHEVELRKQGHRLGLSDPRVEIIGASTRVAAKLDIDPGSNVVSRHQQRWIDGAPASLQRSIYPMWLIDNGAQELMYAADIPTGTVRYLRETLKLDQVGYVDEVSVRQPDSAEREFFQLPETGVVAVMQVDRTAYDGTGRPYRYSTTVYRGDRSVLRMRHGTLPDELGAEA